jgi:putative ATP-binding cassette transporter
VYPSSKSDSFPQSRLAAALEKVGLGALASELDVLEQWPQRLSPGEQQRLAFARVLLAKPACVFLDEATSSVDTAAEARLYGLLRAAAWRPVVVSVGHSEALPKFHDRVLDLAAFQPAQGK